MRAALQRPWLLLAPGLVIGLALLADVSGRRLADGYALEVTLPGWPLVAAAALLGARFLVRRRGAWRVVVGDGRTSNAIAPADAGTASNSGKADAALLNAAVEQAPSAPVELGVRIWGRRAADAQQPKPATRHQTPDT